MTSLALSFFAGKLDNQPTPASWTWEQLAEWLRSVERSSCTMATCGRWQVPQLDCAHKDGGALWSPASYPPGARRAKANVASVSALVLDVDHLPDAVSLTAALGSVSRYQSIAHSSHSDRPGNHCIRFVLALSRPVLGHEWPRFWDAAVQHLQVPADKATRDASRLFFRSSRPADAYYAFAAVDGTPLDVDAVLAAAPLPSEQPVLALAPTAVLLPGTAAPVPPEHFLEAAKKLAAVWAPPGFRHAAHRALRGGLATAGWTVENNAVFCASVAQIAGHELADGDLAKRLKEAQQTAISIEAGETVESWGTLVDRLSEHHAREQVVTTIDEAQRLLGIVGDGAAAAAAFVAQAQAAGLAPAGATAAKARTHEELEAYLTGKRRKLARGTREQDILDAKYLDRVLEKSTMLARPSDPADATPLANAAAALVRHAPPGTSDEQLVELLTRYTSRDDATAAVAAARQSAGNSGSGGVSGGASLEGFELATSGPRAGKPATKSQVNVALALKLLDVRLRYDLLAERIVVWQEDGEPLPFDDKQFNIWWLAIETRFGFLVDETFFAAVCLNLALRDAFHPVRDYLDSLPPWDGVPRLDSWLIDFGGAEDTPFNRAVSRIVLVAAVRRVRSPGCKFDEMLILEGQQGCGKSQAVEALAVRKAWCGTTITFGGDQRKQIEEISNHWFIEAGELASMAKSEVTELKRFLSATKDKARLAYGRFPTELQRQCIIIGTTNEETYLRDTTGNRRFWPVRVQNFDLDGLRATVPLLWAEAAAAEAASESIRLAPELYGIASAVQDERRVEDTLLEVLAAALGDATGKLLNLDVWRILGKDPADDRGQGKRISAAMRQLGWERTKARFPGVKVVTVCWLKGTEEQRRQALRLDGGAIGGWRVGTLVESPSVAAGPN